MLHATKKQMVFRFDSLIPDYPLCVRSVGHYQLAARARMEPARRKWFSEIFWTVSGAGKFVLKSTEVEVQAGDLFYYLPGEVHDLRPGKSEWNYRWITFDHAESVQWLAGFGLRTRPVGTGECPEAQFKAIERALKRTSREGDRDAARCAYDLLMTISARCSPSKAVAPLAERCRQLINEEFVDSELTIESISDRLNVHRSTLFRSFLSGHGISVSRYLQNKRVHEALRLLMEPEVQIQEVAWRSGFKDPNYFARAVRAFTGSSPRELRRR